jgi:cytochrome c peroxidase
MKYLKRTLLVFLAVPLLAAAQQPHGNIAGPLAAPAQTANVVPLSPMQQLGKDLFFDKTLSFPVGYSCATCHLPASGFTGPSSAVNFLSGPQPGGIPGRFGHRKPQAVPYAAFSPDGPSFNSDVGVWLGGNFWDGRALNTTGQARMPFIDPDEMANPATGPLPPHTGGFAALVANKMSGARYAVRFTSLFGVVFGTTSTADIYTDVTQAIAAYEATAEVNPFSSKWDYSVNGILAKPAYRFTVAEERGRVLFFNDAQCFQCHSGATLDPVLALTGGRNSFTMYCFANVGVPKNPNNPFYRETNATTNPDGSNPAGLQFIDYGLGSNPNSAPNLGTPTDGTPFMTSVPGDIQTFRGLFKAPSVRNVDKRPAASFVKAYMHNGVFKSLQEVVHFYNKRNIAVDRSGHEAAFDLAVGPPPGFTPLFPPPEVADNVQNAAGLNPNDPNVTSDPGTNGQVGNLGLTPQQEADIVTFLKTLSDGYSRPTYVPVK